MTYIFIAFIFSILSKLTKKKDMQFFFFIFVIFLVIFASLRYGSGTDYFTYSFIYRHFAIDWSDYKFYMQSVEPGYAFLNIFFNKLNVSFQLFLAIVSACTFCILYKTIKVNSKNLILSLLIFYLNYYVPYFSNQYRQAFAIIFGLAAVCNYINKQKKCFILQIICIAFIFHFSALILLLIPVFDKIFSDKFIFSNIKVILFTFFCFVLSFLSPFLLTFVFNKLNLTIISKLLYYTKSANLNLMPILTRIVFVFIVLLFFHNAVKNSDSNILKKMYRIYIYSLFLYMLFSQFSIFSRFSDYYTFIEILLVPNLLDMVSKKIYTDKKMLRICFLILYSVLFVKDLDDATVQGNYMDRGAMNYPYITVFNKDEIFNYRKISKSILN